MKVLGSLLLLCVFQVLLSERVFAQTKCNSDADCCKNTCCPIPLRGKRSTGLTSSGGGMNVIYNVCMPLSDVNGPCYKDGVATCPRCKPGLFCQGTGVREIPQGEIGICILSGK